ncbi:MAG: AI-2E family transporter [Acidimicrobiia bacterium]|nr:AI-2E family transporter [Acidimicrobiia bacterium]
MTPSPTDRVERRLRLVVGPEPVAVVLLGIALGLVLFGVASAGRRYLGWALASAIVAILLEPAVRWLDRRLPRALAIIASFLVLGAVIGGITLGVLRDLGEQVDRLRRAAPAAAAEIEQSERFGQVARDIELVTRVDEALADLEDPASGVGRQVASSAGTYFLCLILTLSLIGAVPGLIRSAINQIGDERRRERVSNVVSVGFGRAQMYLVLTLALALGVGLLAWGAFALEGVPAPMALAVAVAALSVVPGVGVFVGALPALLLEAGLGTGFGAARLAFAAVVLQALHQLVLRRYIAPRTLLVGPAVIVIALTFGFEVYGIGGAAYTAALAVFAVAAVDVGGALQGKGTGRLVRHAATAD